MRLPFDQLVTPTLLKRFEVEAAAEMSLPHYYALILRDDNDLVAHHPFGPQLDPAQSIWARDVLVKLNRDLHHDGAWVIVFTDPLPIVLQTVLHNAPTHMEYGRYAIIWIDSDGDPQFTMEWINGENSGFKDWPDVLLAGLHSTMQKAEGAWQTWHEMMVRLIDPAEGQTFKKAKGQRPTSATAH